MSKPATLTLLLLLALATLSLASPHSAPHTSQKFAQKHGHPAESDSGFEQPGISYIGSPTSPQGYVGVRGSVAVSTLAVTGDFYPNGTPAGGAAISFQLGATIYSQSAGTYWGVVGLVLNRSAEGQYAFSLLDQLWNETAACSGLGTLDETTDVSGRGSIVVSFPGCFGTHYQYETPVMGTLSPPFNVTLAEYLVPANGSFAIKYNYTLLAGGSVFRGTVDTVTVYPGGRPAPATMRVGGTTQLFFDYGMQLTLAAPNPLETASANNTSGTLTLTPIAQGGILVEPNQTINYGILPTSSVVGVAVYPNLSNPYRPIAVFAPGKLHPAPLWPVGVKSGYTIAQDTPGGPITMAANFTYYDPLTGQYRPLPQSTVTITLNGTKTPAQLVGGVVEYVFEPTTSGQYTVNVTYPASVAFGKPSIGFGFAVASLASNLTRGSANFTLLYPNGSSRAFSLQAGGHIFLLVHPQGLTLEAPTAYTYYNRSTRFGFLEWLVSGGEMATTPKIPLEGPAQLIALFGTQYLVNISIPGRTQVFWAGVGSKLNLSAPQYIYVETNLVRLAFTGWSNGVKTNTTTIVVESPINISANYVVQFKVYISTPESVLIDAYYTNGSRLSVTAPATLGGTFLYPNAFQGWGGTIQSSSRTLKLTVTKPIVDEAIYKISYARVSGLEAAAAIIVGALVAFIAQRKRL